MDSIANHGRQQSWVHRIFHEKTAALNLAIFRAVVFGELAWIAVTQLPNNLWFAALPRELSAPLPGWRRILPLLPLDRTTMLIASVALTIAALCAAIGFLTTISSSIALALSLYVLGVPEFFVRVSHETHHLVWFAMILVVSDAGSAWSVDAWRQQRNSGIKPPSEVPALPIRIVWILFGIIYFFPGFWKLVAPDRGWMLGDTLQLYIYSGWMETVGQTPPFHFNPAPGIFRLAGIGAVAMEISFIALVQFRRTRPSIATAGALFHLFTWLWMGIDFRLLLFCYVVFFDWGRFQKRDPQPERQTGAPLRIALAGVILILVNVACGLAIIESWPFTIYPRLDLRPMPIYQSLAFEEVDTDGVVHSIDPLKLKAHLPHGRWKAFARRIAAGRPGAWRDRTVADLVALLEPDGVDLRTIRALRIFGEERPITARGMEVAPSKRELIAEIAGGR